MKSLHFTALAVLLFGITIVISMIIRKPQDYFVNILADMGAVVLGLLIYDRLYEQKKEISLIETNWNLIYYTYLELIDEFNKIDEKFINVYRLDVTEKKAVLYDVRPIFENIVKIYEDINEIFPKKIKNRMLQYKVRIKSQYKLIEYELKDKVLADITIDIAIEKLHGETKDMINVITDNKEDILDKVS